MRRTLRIFFAGKIDPLSRYVSPRWREHMAWELNESLAHYRIIDCCIPELRNRFLIENDLAVSVLFSQSCYYIKQSDALVVNLSDDISVGGSQEIFIAKLFNKPVIGIARRGGKFNRLSYKLNGKTYWNWVHPFVGSLCDLIVNDTAELAAALDEFPSIPVGGLRSVEQAVNYYQRNASALDTTVNAILSLRGESIANKPKLRIYFAGKMGVAEGFSTGEWRDELSAIISRGSRFGSVNLDFLEGSHSVVDENDSTLIFGRDAYLIRSSDLVIANLSDDISVGGSIEMLLAKLYQRPLIGIAKPDGKFVSPDKDMFGRTLHGYVNPFVSAACDWLVHHPSQLPAVVDELFMQSVKSHHIIPASARWYEQRMLAADKAAQATFALV